MDETLMILSVLSFLLTGVFGMISVVLWIQFDVPGMLKEFKGRSARGCERGDRKTVGSEAESATERLERAPGPKGMERKVRDAPEDVMIIHTDEEIRLPDL